MLLALVDFDVSEVAFPYLAVREGAVAGVPARLMRVGFVGELGYEIHVAIHNNVCMVDGSVHQLGPRWKVVTVDGKVKFVKPEPTP